MVAMVGQEVLRPQSNLLLKDAKPLLHLLIGKEEKQDMMDLEVLVEILK